MTTTSDKTTNGTGGAAAAEQAKIQVHFTVLDQRSALQTPNWNSEYEVTVTRKDGRGMSDIEVATVLKRSLTGARLIPLDEIHETLH